MQSETQRRGGGSVPRVGVVVEDGGLRTRLLRLLEGQGFAVRGVARADDARALLRPDRPGALLLDFSAPDGPGLEALEAATAPEVGVPVVALVEEGDVAAAVEAMRRGAARCLAKPLETERLVAAVEEAVGIAGHGGQARDGDDVRGELDFAVVGRSPALGRTLDLVRRVAPTRSAVLVAGQTGTGKELVARAVHQLSPRSPGPFVPVVCSALPETLLEAELFGHRKGSFTGAHADRRGLVQAADGGSLFLDEISTVPPDVQVKLLRVLEERKVRPVGGGSPSSVDFRLVAATNVDLASEVDAGRFREDLYYRLNVFPIRVPPLRERKEDIPLLAEHFRRRFAEENDVDPPAIPRETLVRMMEYDWPGNVRELEHFVERAMILYADAPAIRFDAPGRMFPDQAEALLGRAETEEWELDRLEREYILRVLERAEGNRSRAAEILGVHRRTIARKMERYRVPGRPRRGSNRRDAGRPG